MIPQDHPFFFLMPLFAKEGTVFYISKYVYTPDALFDDRETLEIPGNEMSEEWLERLVTSLPSEQELAFHSRVSAKGRTMHVPMIDFACEAMTVEIGQRIRQFLPLEICRSMAFFATGRSFHAYSLELLTPQAWNEFMGRLLLINPKGGPQIIDTRWVGHRIIGKYASLRWTNNSSSYLSLPRKIDSPFLSRSVVNY